jgi:hypothetical protein
VLLVPRVYGDDKEGDGDDSLFSFPRLPLLIPAALLFTTAPPASHSRASRFSFPQPASLSRVGGNLELFVLLVPRVYGDDKEGDGDDSLFSFPRLPLLIPAALLFTTAPPASHSRVGGNLELFVLLDPRVYGDDKRKRRG